MSIGIHLILLGTLMLAALLSADLFANELNLYCPQLSTVFLKTTYNSLDRKAILLLLVTTALSLLVTIALSLVLLSLATLIWEDFLRPLLLHRPLSSQIRALKVIFFFKLTTRKVTAQR